MYKILFLLWQNVYDYLYPVKIGQSRNKILYILLAFVMLTFSYLFNIYV